jgi:hypothetical protein
MIILTITEIDNSGRYDAHVDDRYLLTSASPFLDAARLLLEQGYDPNLRLQMRRPGRDQIDMSAPLGKAAGLVVKPGSSGCPIFARYRDRAQIGRPAPLVSQNEPAATPVAAEAA